MKHWPHPGELEKRAMMARETADEKGVSYAEHPGHGWWLCQPCGTWHKGPPPSRGILDIELKAHEAGVHY